MSVNTDADDKLDSIRKHLDSAIKGMRNLIIDEPWGWDEYKEEYRNNLEEKLLELKKIRKEI